MKTTDSIGDNSALQNKEVNEEATIESFLRSFFSGRPGENLFTYADIREGTRKTHNIMQQWLASLKKSPHTTVLPRFLKVDGKAEVTWYGVARSGRGLRRLADEVRAFVGPTYADFTGQRASLDLDDPIDAAVADFTGGNVFIFQGNDDAIRDALVLMHEVRSQQKQRDMRVYRSPGIILREFHMALAAENEEAAREALQYMREHSLISALNRDFLQIQFHRAFGRWDAVLAMDLEDILAVRRPLAVTEALIQAVYHHHLSRFEEAGDAEGALQQYEDVVRPAFGSLFGMRSTMRVPEVLKTFMLKAVAPDTADAGLRTQLLEEAEAHEVELPFLQKLAALGEAAPLAREEEAPGAPLEEATKAFEHGDFDQAYELALGLLASPGQAQLLLLCSYELQSVEAERTAIQAIDALPGADRQAILERRIHRNIYEELTGDAEQAAAEEQVRVPDDWIGWFERLEAEPAWNRARAIEIAERGAREWRVDDLLASHDDAVHTLKTALEANRPQQAERTVLHALPHLLAYLQKDKAFPRPRMQPVYEAMSYLVALTPGKGPADLDLFYILCETLLAQGITEGQYTEMVETAKVVWAEVEAPRYFTWGLDMIDLLVMFPQPDPEASLRLLQSIVATFRRYRERSEQEELLMLRRLCDEMGHGGLCANIETEEAIDATDPLEALEGKSVAVYTLTERAGGRMKELLEEACDGITVHLSHSKVATPRLKDLALRADIFIMATASAAHAATNYIRDKRGDFPLVIPQGKGTSSMMRELRTYLGEHVGAVRA